MNIEKHLKEIKEHLESIILDNDASNLNTEQLTSLGKALGIIEYLIEKEKGRNE